MSGHSSYLIRTLADADLRARLEDLVRQERENLGDVVEHLMEVDRRENALDRGYPSLFVYCVKALGYSEQAAYARIRAARAAARIPDILARLRSGNLHLDAVLRLAPYLTAANQHALLAQADGASKRQVMELVATLETEPAPARDVVDPISPPRPRAEEAQDPTPVILKPPAHRFHFTAEGDLLGLVERLRGHLRHKYPEGRLEDIFGEACRSLLEGLERRLLTPSRGRSEAPAGPAAAPSRPPSRRVPAAVRREVWARDGGRCSYAAPDGRHCGSREALELDHIVPWAEGGRSDTPENIRLLCRGHNQRLSRKRFGTRPRRGS